MRFLITVSFPVEMENASEKNGYQAIQGILEEHKPEAAYFVTRNGKRAAVLIMNVEEESQLAVIAEPWFLALDAEIDSTPAMVAADVEKAGPGIAHAVTRFGTGGVK